MPYSVKILADSVNSVTGKRLTTFELQFPHFILPQLSTHRIFSKNSASSRAVPLSKAIQKVIDDPAIPLWWGKAQSGMQANEELSAEDCEEAKRIWLESRDLAVAQARKFETIGLHKQISARCLETFSFITVILSATEFANFFKLRCDDAAQPEMQWLAKEMKKVYDEHEPKSLVPGAWHLPLIDDDDKTVARDVAPNYVDFLKRVSVGRIARVSFLNHDGKRDHVKDIELHDKLLNSGHYSPFESVACASSLNVPSGNFTGGWIQYRQIVEKGI